MSDPVTCPFCSNIFGVPRTCAKPTHEIDFGMDMTVDEVLTTTKPISISSPETYEQRRDRMADAHVADTVCEGGNGEEMEACFIDYCAGYNAGHADAKQAEAVAYGRGRADERKYSTALAAQLMQMQKNFEAARDEARKTNEELLATRMLVRSASGDVLILRLRAEKAEAKLKETLEVVSKALGIN